MEGTLTLRQTTIGKKALMAVSGVLLIGFLIAHLLGNLQLYAGPEKINAYAAGLRKLGPLLWVARLALLGAIIVHMTSAFQLWMLAKKARPIPYQKHVYQSSSYAARTMRWGGIILLFSFFITSHISLAARL
ncbi:MAG: hypothetical protein IPJ88_14560 [Myxococcales bacterium]|nr:MAG: hypothetical protein IPJ88_14560 [Myxococcales bacterium]